MLAVSLAGCGGANAARAMPSPRTPARAALTPAPVPAPASTPVDAGELEVRVVPLLSRALAEPDPLPVVTPLLPQAARAALNAYAATPDADDRAREAARARATTALAAVSGARAASPGSLRYAAEVFARAYLNEGDGGEAAALYREVFEAVPPTEPLGWLSRFRRAVLLETEQPAESRALFDALLDVPLTDPWMRGALPAVFGHPLLDWGRAAQVARALWMSAVGSAPSSRTPEASSLHEAWLAATYDAGNWQGAFELARLELSRSDTKGPALAVAAAAVAHEGGGGARVPTDLPAETYASLVALVGERGAAEGDVGMADEAAQVLSVHAPGSPHLAALRANVQALRAAKGDPSVDVRKAAFVLRARGLVLRCFTPSSARSEVEPAPRGDRATLVVRFERTSETEAPVPVITPVADGETTGSLAAPATSLGKGRPPGPWFARSLACAERNASRFFDGDAPYGYAVVHVAR